MKKVLFQGTFEIINAGHILCLKKCKDRGDYLIVALNTNELVKSYKKREAILPWEEKKLILEAIRYVDEVVPAPEFSPIKLLQELDIDVYCIAREWEEGKSEEIAYMLSHDKEIFFTEDFGLVHTSEIKRRLLAEAKGI